jgi:cobalt-zinc-cadmium resistance protein CzcA
MVRRLVDLALRNRVLVLAAALLLVACGLYAFKRLPVEAYPNPCPPLVEVIAQPPGWSAEETERYVTVPLEAGLAGMPGLDHVRSQSLFGLADVKCYFRWGTPYEQARQEVINRLQFVQLPGGIQASISPWNAIGEIFRYTLRGKGYSLTDLKTAEDWILERQWKQVPGVVDVTSFGGLAKEYHVDVDPYQLRARGVTLAQVNAALANANQNVGGQRLTLGSQAFTIRGIGLIGSLANIEDIVIVEQKGVPVRVRDVAAVGLGHAPRLGQVGKDAADEVVEGIVLMRYGAETDATLRGVRARLQYIRDHHLLPPGMEIAPYYDRGSLVQLTTHTVLVNLLIGMALVTLVLVLFLANLRAALLTAVNVPLALLCAFIGMVATGTPANLISLGAVDFGIVVDSTVIMMENIFRQLRQGDAGPRTMPALILDAAAEVGRPMGFSTLIIAVSFLPLFALTGVAGEIFRPMAHTYAFAIGGAILLAVFLTPVASARVLSPRDQDQQHALMRLLHRIYDPLFDAALRRPRLSAALCLVPVVACAALFPLLGREFMPKLEEGNLWIRVTFPTSVSLEESMQHVPRLRQILRGHAEVLTVVSQLGRPDDGTDVAGFQNVELFAPLKPFEDWPRGLTKGKLTATIERQFAAEFPGAIFNFSQYISDNVEEALSGVKGENSVKVTGPDLADNDRTADAIHGVMLHVRGIAEPGVFRSLGQPSIRIVPDRLQCQRYGLNTGDVEAVVQAAIGGQAVTQVYEGEKLFNLIVRWREQDRSSIAALKRITVATPDGSQVPLGELASVTTEDGATVVYREDGRRYTPVKFSVRGRDLGSAIAEAQQRIAAEVRLSPETNLVWAGEINELHDAADRLRFIVPLTILLVAFLVYSSVRNWLDTLLVLISIPVAVTGGLLALLIAGEPLSVSAAMGFISIFGIAIQDALLMISYAQQLHGEGMSLEAAARQAAAKRFRPVLMTTLVATLGLLPAALSHGIGAQTQRPLAIVVIGGALQLAVLTRLLQPPLRVIAWRWLEARRARAVGRDDMELEAA